MTSLRNLLHRIDRAVMHAILGPDPLVEIVASYRPRSDADALAASFRASDQRVRW